MERISTPELKERAKEFAEKKWQYIIDNKGSDKGLKDELPLLAQFNSECSYCELYVERNIKKVTDKTNYHKLCENCPVFKIGGYSCHDDKSVYATWNRHSTVKKAQRMLDIIKKIEK